MPGYIVHLKLSHVNERTGSYYSDNFLTVQLMETAVQIAHQAANLTTSLTDLGKQNECQIVIPWTDEWLQGNNKFYDAYLRLQSHHMDRLYRLDISIPTIFSGYLIHRTVLLRYGNFSVLFHLFFGY